MRSRSVTSKPDAELAEWCSVLSSAQPVDAVPAGWMTIKQIAKQTGKAESTIGALVCRAVANGQCKRTNFRIRTGSMVRPVPHYKLT